MGVAPQMSTPGDAVRGTRAADVHLLPARITRGVFLVLGAEGLAAVLARVARGAVALGAGEHTHGPEEARNHRRDGSVDWCKYVENSHAVTRVYWQLSCE